MATVPGTPMDQEDFGGVHPSLRPTQADLLIAAAIMHQQGKMQMAGDVVQMPGLYDRVKAEQTADPDFAKKAATRATLMRAIGGGAKVLPITPDKDQ